MQSKHRFGGKPYTPNALLLNTWITHARRLVRVMLTALILIQYSIHVYADDQLPTIKFGITPVILNQQTQFLNDWRVYLEKRLNHAVRFIQRDSYGKITTLLLKGELDFAWICGYPYVQHQNLIELVAVPLYQDKPFYQSYLIVPITDKKTRSILDLKNIVFAYSDPDSNSGYLYAQYILNTSNQDAKNFFKKTFFTWEHRNTVEAVATGLAQAGIVDGYIWETMQKQHSTLTENTRVAHKSKLFGFPPIVSRKNISSDLRNRMQHILIAMHDNKEGQLLLKFLNLDKLIPGKAERYNAIRQMNNLIHKIQSNDT